MNASEAQSVLAAELAKYRGRSYEELRQRIGTQDDFWAAGASGTRYAIEIDFLWDDKRNGYIRVVGMVDGDGWRKVFPMSDSFIMGPSGEFIDENPA